MRPLDTGGGGTTGKESGSANAAEHRYFPGTSTDRKAKSRKKPKSRSSSRSSRSSSEGYVSPFKAISMAVGPVWKGPSAMDMIMTQIPSPKINYQREAKKIYQPTLDYLTGQGKQARTRSTANDRALSSMYGGLAANIQGQDRAINAQYAGAKNSVNTATEQGVNAVDQNYDSAAREQAAMMKQLGIQAAAPDVLKEGTNDEAFFKSLMQSSGNAANTMLEENRVSEQDFNRAQANISRQSGADARSENRLQLGDILSQIGGKKADIMTTVNQQAASMQSAAVEQRLEAQKQAAAALQQDRQFAMQQANYGLQAQTAAQNYNLQQQRFALDAGDRSADNDMAQARLALDTAKFETGSQEADRQYKLALQKLATGGSAATPVDAWGKGAELATKLYGGNQQAAGNAIAAVRDAIAANGDAASQWKNPNDLVRAVLKRNPGATDVTQLTSLATYLFQQIFK